MDNEYIEELVSDFMGTVERLVETIDEYEWKYKAFDMAEHELRNLITKVILHTQTDDGIGEP